MRISQRNLGVKRMEQNYEFRKRLRQVHRPNRADSDLQSRTDECEVDQNWDIVLPDC